YYRESETSLDWLAASEVNYEKLPTSNDWTCTLNSSKTMKPGFYDLRITILDSDGAIDEVELLDAFQALNNAPIIERVVLEPTSILRRDFVTIFIYGGDVETSRTNMTVDLQYRLAFEGVSWSELNTTPKTTHWEAVFYTNIETLTGNYTFRARIKDANNVRTNYHYPDSELKVLNNPPVAVHNFGVDILSVNEDEKIWFDATNSSDIEDSICSEFLWEFGDGLSSTDPKTSHMYPHMGEYNVTLTVYDKNYGSNTTKITIEVLNIRPTVVTIVDKIQAQVNEPILFDGSGSSDTSSDYANLTYLWDFDDNTTSNESKVTHAFTESGTFSVSLTITDDNGASDSSTLFITIEPLPPKKRDDSDDNGNLLYVMGKIAGIPVLLLLIIIIIILVLIAVVMQRRKAAKEPAKPGMIEKPIETLEADIVETPALGAGKTMKPGKACGTKVLET
ncbi:MAG: PKD domain-containing protein, partial [Thermoplasmata archaeon]|nr:PKD domain-containing protein [Thermoplasmata archaeon]